MPKICFYLSFDAIIKYMHNGISSNNYISEVHLMFTGDIIGNLPILQDALGKGGDDYDFSDMLYDASLQLKQADLAIANIEGPIFKPPYTGYPLYNSPKKLVADAQAAGISFFSTANNHSFDCGEKGLISTLDALDSLGCQHTGTYRSGDEKDCTQGVCITAAGDMRIAVLNYTYGINFIPISKSQEGLISIYNLVYDQDTLHLPNTELMEKGLAYARLFAPDLIIVLMHWGLEEETEPNEYQRWIAQFLVSCGADLVVGNHPHVLQRYERLTVKRSDGSKRVGHVFYSLGNMLSNQSSLENRVTVIPDITLRHDKKSGRAVISGVGYVPYYMYFYHNAPFGDDSMPWGAQRKLVNIHQVIRRFEHGERSEILNEALYMQCLSALSHCHRVIGCIGDLELQKEECDIRKERTAES